MRGRGTVVALVALKSDQMGSSLTQPGRACSVSAGQGTGAAGRRPGRSDELELVGVRAAAAGADARRAGGAPTPGIRRAERPPAAAAESAAQPGNLPEEHRARARAHAGAHAKNIRGGVPGPEGQGAVSLGGEHARRGEPRWRARSARWRMHGAPEGEIHFLRPIQSDARVCLWARDHKVDCRNGHRMIAWRRYPEGTLAARWDSMGHGPWAMCYVLWTSGGRSGASAAFDGSPIAPCLQRPRRGSRARPISSLAPRPRRCPRSAPRLRAPPPPRSAPRLRAPLPPRAASSRRRPDRPPVPGSTSTAF